MDEKEVLRRGYAKTREEWWLLVVDQWGELLNLIALFQRPKIGAAAKAFEKREAEQLWDVLQRTWEAAPDKPGVHQLVGWGRLCDLLSDFPEEENNDDKN